MSRIISQRPNTSFRLRAVSVFVLLFALGAEGDVAVGVGGGDFAQSARIGAQNQKGFSYSQWIRERDVYGAADAAEKDSVEFAPQTFREQPGSFWGDVADKVRDGTTQRLRSSLLGVLPRPGELRAILVKYGNGEEFDMAQWREIRKQQLKAAIENAPLAFYADTETALANAISQTAVDRLGFVRRARVDFRTSLGDRQASGGVDAAGALRESEDEVIGWQLRAFAGESGKRGGNIGAFWRRAQWLHFVDEGLLGANIFADYEDTDDGSFWRWSIGGEMKTRVGDVNVNRYFVLTDPVVLANNRRVYSRAGLDIDAALNIPGAEWAKARVGYFLWEGEFGDADIEGFKAGFDFKPGAGVVVGIEFDGESGDIGGNFSYTHNIGEPFASAQSAGVFDPRAHFFDAVRREYSQRIVNTGAGDGANFAVIVTTGLDITIRGELPGASTTVRTLNIAAASLSIGVNNEFAITGNVTVETNTTPAASMAVFRQKGGNWHLTLNANSEVAFTNTARILIVNRGSGEFERVNPPNPEMVDIQGAVTLSLIGTRFRFGVPSAVSPQNKASITLVEGGMMVASAAMDRVTIKVGERASVMVMMGGSMVVVGCGEGQVANADGVGAICIGGGGAVEPVSLPPNPNVSVEGGRVLVPFGALVTVGRYSLSMVNTDITLMASVETPGFSLAVSTAGTGGGRYFAFDIVIEESAATVAGVKNPRVSVTDPAFNITREVVFTVEVARSLAVRANPGNVLATQNITVNDISQMTGDGGVTPYKFSVVGGQESNFTVGADDGALHIDARINAADARDVIVEITDGLGSKASVTVTVTLAPTPPLVFDYPAAGHTAVAATTTIGVNALHIRASGGAPPLSYDFQQPGAAGFVTVANIPQANGGGRITLDEHGVLYVQANTDGEEFDLTLRVSDAVNTRTSLAIKVSLSEGLVLSGPVVNAVFTVTTHGGGNRSGVSRTLGVIMAQSQTNIAGWQFIRGGNSYVSFAGGGNTSNSRTVVYNGSQNATGILTVSVEVRDVGGTPTPSSATASFMLEVVNPPDVEAGLSGAANLRYFVGEESAVLTVTASGGAGGNVFRISSGSGARVGNDDGVLHFNGGSTSHVTVTVFADDRHNLTEATPAVTVTLSALARLNAPVARGRITTGSTLSGANANVVTVSVSGGENRAAFAYSRINEGTQLTGADINNSGVIFAADNTRIDAVDAGSGTGGNRNFIYEVIDGAIVARRQTLTATAVIESIVPQPIAADVSPVGNNVITVGADATARLNITPRGGGGAYNFRQENAANIVMAAQADANNAAVFIVNINAPSAAGTASVSIVIDDEHFATEPLTLARQFIAIDNLAASYAGGARFSPLTANADIKFATINIAGGLNPRAPTFVSRTGPNNTDLRFDDSAADNRQFALVLGGGARNTIERTITFAVSIPADNGDAVTISGTVEVVDRVKLRGGGRITVFAEADAGDVVAEFKPVGGVPPYSNLNKLVPSGALPAGLQESAAAQSVTITRTNTDLTAGDEHTIAYEVSDSTDGGAVYASATAMITVINSLAAQFNIGAAAGDAKGLGGGALETGLRQTVGTISGSGGVGGYHISQVPANFEIVEGTILAAQFNDVVTASYNFVVDDDNAPITEPVTLAVSITALAPLRTIDGILLTVHTGSSPTGIIGEWQPTGGNERVYSPSYRIGTIPGGFDFPLHGGGVNNLVRIGSIERGASEPLTVRLFFTGNRAPLTAGTVEFENIEVVDNSSPPRRTGLASPLTIILVNPPTVTANVNQTISRYRKGASVTLATLSYSGGTGASGLTASVLGFYQGNSRASVIDNEVVVWPDPAVTQRGTARITVVTYDADNSTAPASTLTFAMYVVDALRWTSPPSEPLTVTTQGFQSGSFFNNNDALPRQVAVVGGNADNSYNLGSRTPGFALSTQNQQFSYTGNSGRFAQDADTVLVTVYGIDRTAPDNYRQTTSLTITVAFIDPQESVTIGFATGFDTAPLTAGGDITIGEVVVGGGLSAKDPTILGSGGDFRIEDGDSGNTGRAFLILGGDNTTDRAATVTLSGNDDHTRTDAALVTVTVNVVDRVKLQGAGMRYTVLAQAGNAVAEIFKFEPVGGMPDADDGYSVQTAIEPTNLPTGFTRSSGATVVIGRNAVSIATGEHVFIQRVADTTNTVQGTATVEVINELALTIGDTPSGGNFRGDIILPGGFPFGKGFASGGAGAYTYRVEGPGIGGNRNDVRVDSSGVMIAGHSSTHPAATITYTLIADDTADATAPATALFTLTVLQPVSAAPLPVITVTTKSTPGGAGSSGGGTVPAFTIDASGGQPSFAYYLGGAQTPGTLADDILYYTADSANNGVIYFNTGVQASAEAGDNVITPNLQVRDSSAPTRNDDVPGMLTIRYVLPPPVTVAVNQTVSAYKTGVSITVAELTYSGGAGGNLAATVLGVAGDTVDITVQVSGGNVLVSASATGTITATINAYDTGNDTAENDTTTLTVEFVPPLVINDIPEAVLEITTRDAQPTEVAAGIALPRQMTASGGNGTYTYNNVRTALFGAGSFTSGFSYANGILRQSGNTFQSSVISVQAIAVVTDNEVKGYRQSVTAIITVNYIHPPALSMGFVESPVVAALTTANDITIGTIALTGGLTELSIVITGDDDFELSLIESSSATAALILSGNNERARTVAVTITGNDNHLEIAAQLLSITARINDALTLISTPPGITITAGKIDGFTGVENMTAILANLNVQGNLSDDITVSIIDAAADNLTMSLRNLLSLTGDNTNWTLDITSSSIAQTHIGTPYNLAFEIHDAAMSIATVTIPVSVVNAPVRADTEVSVITTYFYTGITGEEVTLTSITFTNLYIPTDETASITITVAPTDNAETNKYTPALSAITNAAGAVEIKYTRPTENAPQTADDFTLNATVIISTGATSKNPFTATATLQWKIGGIPALSIDFQSPPNTVFIRGYKGTIGVLTVTS